MSRELVVQIIKKKKALHEKHHALVIAELAVEEELAYAPSEKEASFEDKKRQVNTSKLAIEVKLKRSHLFGQRYAQDFIPSFCIVCFVDHNTESFMMEVESELGNGIRQFECPVCKDILRVNPI